MPNIGPRSIIWRCIGVIRRNHADILRGIWLPSIAASGLFYITLNLYLGELETFLNAPSEARAAVVLGLVSAAFLLQLLLYMLAVAAVSRLALGQKNPGSWFSLRLGHQEGRLYAASLRFMLLMFVLVAAAWLTLFGLGKVGASPVVQDVAGALLVAVLAVLALRAGFLLPAVAIATRSGLVIRSAWRLSSGIVLPLVVIVLAVGVPGILLELAGEAVSHSVSAVAAGIHPDTIRDRILLVRAISPTFAIFTSLSIMLVLTLQAIASAIVYQDLMEDDQD